ncbi:MAG: hypothetical protein V1647_01020 [Pseudomonadota bacterium]
MDLNTIRQKALAKPVFNPRNYRNSPLIREFYRFIAKNGLRAEAHKLLESAGGSSKSKTSYLSNITLN